RNLPWRAAMVRRIGWSIVHFFVGCVAFAVVGSYVNIWATGSYRGGPSNRVGIFAAVIAVSIPWLGLLWGRGGGRKEGREFPIRELWRFEIISLVFICGHLRNL